MACQKPLIKFGSVVKAMTEPRLSTVFDYSSLLLHPDGTRVYQKPTARAAVRTSRNHWVAKDAGGLGKIHKFKRTPKEDISRDLQEDEEFDGLSAEMDGFEPEDKGKVFEGQPSSVCSLFNLCLSNNIVSYFISGPFEMHSSLCFRILYRVWPVVKYFQRLSQAKEKKANGKGKANGDQHFTCELANPKPERRFSGIRT